MTALAGKVMTQERAISRSILRLMARIPLARPTPKTAPTRQCVVEIGNPSFEAIKIVVAAPNSAQKPRVGVSSVIFLPIVSMTRQPHVARPTTIPRPPNAKSQRGTTETLGIIPFLITSSTAATGPIALATSLAPWAKATKHALMICK